MTYTLNDWFGARVVAAGTGVLLNDEMDDFTPNPGVANIDGLVQGDANAIAPGKTPLSSMSPTIVTKDGKPVLILGTPGGSRIITTVLQTILNVVDFQMNIQEAVDAPRIHHQWLPDVTNVERYALSPDTRNVLERMGYRFDNSHPANHVAAIIVGAPSLGGTPIGRNRFYGAQRSASRHGTGAGLLANVFETYSFRRGWCSRRDRLPVDRLERTFPRTHRRSPPCRAAAVDRSPAAIPCRRRTESLPWG